MVKVPRYFATAITVLLISLALYGVTALVPLGPSSLTRGADETQVPYGYQTTTAVAGNITELTIDAVSQTKSWQGYYGDITGTIVLDDAENYTLYDWPLPEPKGEIYALKNATTPAWATMKCFNFSDGTGAGFAGKNLTYWEHIYNMTWNDKDGIDETFNMTTHRAIDVGTVKTVDANSCPSTFMHMNDTFQADNFNEVLLQDSNGYLIFTAIIENRDTANNTDIQGFKGAVFTPDFQMLVAEDGKSRISGQVNTARTPYYFYVDIE